MDKKTAIYIFLIIGCMSLLLSSCNDDDSEPESNVYSAICYVDSIGQEKTIEGIIGKSKLDAPQIQVKDNSVLTITTKADGLHYIIPKQVGYSQIQLNSNGNEYIIVFIASAEGCERWQITDVESNVICSNDVKESIINDIEKRNLFSQMKSGDELRFGTDPRHVEIWYNKYLGETNDDNPKSLTFSYEQDAPHYLFQDEKNTGVTQRMSFTLTSKVQTHGDYFNKEGVFRYDPTLIYQRLYGEDKVQQVVVEYKVKNIINFL